MSTHKHIDKICILITILTMLLTILFMNGKALGIAGIGNEAESGDMFSENDLNADWSTFDACEISLSDDGSTVKGNGAYVYNGDIYIVYAGKYILSGELGDGNIIINADRNDKIWLMLNGISIQCSHDAALRIEEADKVFLTLGDKTVNTISTGSEYSADLISAGVDGAIYSRDDLTINGSGTLNITTEYGHGIVVNDDLVIAGGNITIDSVQDGLHANDSIRIKDANLGISAGDDGITVSNDDEMAFLYIESGSIDIFSCYEGLEAIDITIAGGTINIAPTDDGINANGSGKNAVIRITGGDITIVNANGKDADGIDSNKDIYISGGKLFISVVGNGSNSAIDYGTENGGVCEISGGTVLACGGSAMAEGFDASSPQGFLMYNTQGTAGTTVTLENADKDEILSEEIPCSFSFIVVSTPKMAVGEACIITVGETKEEVIVDNSSSTSTLNQGGMFDRGMQGGESKGKMPTDNPTNFENSNEAPQNMPSLSGNQDFGAMPGALPTPPDGTTLQEGSQAPDHNDHAQPDFSKGNQDFAGRPNNDKMQRPDDTDLASEENSAVQESDHTALFSEETLFLLGISISVLIFGIAVAFVFRQRS